MTFKKCLSLLIATVFACSVLPAFAQGNPRNTRNTPKQVIVPETLNSMQLNLNVPEVGISDSEPDIFQQGKASFYGNGWHGRKCANGETFNMYEYTCAHRTLPFGTLLKVTNTKNGNSVIVRVNDRGPYIKGRVIDLSKAAAGKIDMLQAGVVPVTIEILDPDTAHKNGELIDAKTRALDEMEAANSNASQSEARSN